MRAPPESQLAVTAACPAVTRDSVPCCDCRAGPDQGIRGASEWWQLPLPLLTSLTLACRHAGTATTSSTTGSASETADERSPIEGLVTGTQRLQLTQLQSLPVAVHGNRNQACWARGFTGRRARTRWRPRTYHLGIVWATSTACARCAARRRRRRVLGRPRLEQLRRE